MLEPTGNIDYLILMMVTVLSSRPVAEWLARHSFADEVIRAKGYQVPEPCEPAVMRRLTAGSVCARSVVCLRLNEDVAGVVRAMPHITHTAIPACAEPGTPPPATGNADGDGDGAGGDNRQQQRRHFPLWQVETGGHAEGPELLGLVARSTLPDIREEMVNRRQLSEREVIVADGVKLRAGAYTRPLFGST